MSIQNRKTNALITLDSIVSEVIRQLGKQYENERIDILSDVVYEYTNLNLFYIKSLEYEVLKIKDNGTATLPGDYIDYSKIALIKNDRSITLSRTDNFVMVHDEICGVEQKNDYSVLKENVFDSEVFPCYGNFGNVNYAAPSNREIGEFRINKELRRIELSTRYAKQIYIEYFSSGISIDFETLIPVQAREALVEMVCYKIEKNIDSTPANKLMIRKADVKAAKHRLAYFELSFTVSELKDIIRQNQHQSIKR